MAELIFLVVFVAVLMVYGVTLLSICVALGIALAVMLLLGMLGIIFKLLPWLILAAIGVWLFQRAGYGRR